MRTSWAPLALAAALAAGCASDGVNPYAAGTRDDGVSYEAGELLLACDVADAAAADGVTAALTAAVAEGGGTVDVVKGAERDLLLDYLRAKRGSGLSASLRHYEASIVARIRDPLAPMRIAWTLGTDSVWLPVDGKSAKLLDEGPNRYKLVVDAPANKLVVSGEQLVRLPTGKGYSFKTPPFRLYLKEPAQRISLRVREEKAVLYPENRLLLLRVSGFTGSVGALYESFLGQDPRVSEDGPRVRLVHTSSVMFLQTQVEHSHGEGSHTHDGDDDHDHEGEGDGEEDGDSDGDGD